MSTGLDQALMNLRPGAEFHLKGSKLTWVDLKQTEPSQAEIDAELKRLQEEWDAQAYARNRKAEYDALNQFEMQYDDKKNSTTTWDDAIDAIKAKWPKDNSGPV